MTLAFLPDGVADENVTSMLAALGLVASDHSPIEGEITGHARFPDNGDGEPQIALPSCVGLDCLRVDVIRALDRLGIVYATNFGWIPHMTLGYGDTVDDAIGEPVSFAAVSLTRGDVRRDVPLGRPADEYLTV